MKAHAEAEAAKPDPNQINLFDVFNLENEDNEMEE